MVCDSSSSTPASPRRLRYRVNDDGSLGPVGDRLFYYRVPWALALVGELSAAAHSSSREDYRKEMFDAMVSGGMRSFLEVRDGPFQPEPFGPRSKRL